jgi:hypothetical protein
MNILETLLKSAQGGAVQDAAAGLGLDPDKAQALIKGLVPALAGGLKNNVSASGGLEGLTNALSTGNHARYLDDAAALTGDSARDEGNAILGHLLGSKQVSREVAGQAAEQTGVDTTLIKKFLPIVAAAAMAALSKQTGGGAALKDASAGDGLGGLLGGLLGDDAGDTLGNLLSMGKKFLQ